MLSNDTQSVIEYISKKISPCDIGKQDLFYAGVYEVVSIIDETFSNWNISSRLKKDCIKEALNNHLFFIFKTQGASSEQVVTYIDAIFDSYCGVKAENILKELEKIS